MYGRPKFLPLHAFVQGSLCRPWNLALTKHILEKFGNEAGKTDGEGNLPLHLFLESCMVERSRAIRIGYAADEDDYHVAVQTCFGLLLAAHPRAAASRNGAGRLPLHLALESCRQLPADAIVEPLLGRAPEALLARDTDSRLYPFASAAVGPSSNIDLSYNLLRRDPSVLSILGYGFS